jgi:hypothetical protein
MDFLAWAKANNIEIDQTDLEKVEVLKISKLQIKALPSCLIELKNLKELEISDCDQLVNIDFSIMNREQLFSISVYNCNTVESINLDNTDNAEHLQFFNVRSCANLNRLPKNLGLLENLMFVSICDCPNLLEIPSSLGASGKLRSLSVSGCKSITELPSALLESKFLNLNLALN